MHVAMHFGHCSNQPSISSFGISALGFHALHLKKIDEKLRLITGTMNVHKI